MNKYLVILVVIVALLVITKPSDQSCVDQIKDQVNTQIANSNQGGFIKAVEEVGVDLGSQFGLRIEDNFFFKSIYIKGSNNRVGIGILGMVVRTN